MQQAGCLEGRHMFQMSSDSTIFFFFLILGKMKDKENFKESDYKLYEWYYADVHFAYTII